MGGIVKGLLRLVMLGWLVAWVGALVGAIAVKRRTVAHDAPDGDDIVLVAIFSQLDFTSTARALRDAEVECWFGGGAIDLRSATLDPFGADLRVRAVFGGGQIVVPASWRVSVGCQGLGSVQDARPSDDIDLEGPELRIDAMVMFGGFQIVSEATWRDRAAGDDGWRAVPMDAS